MNNIQKLLLIRNHASIFQLRYTLSKLNVLKKCNFSSPLDMHSLPVLINKTSKLSQLTIHTDNGNIENVTDDLEDISGIHHHDELLQQQSFRLLLNPNLEDPLIKTVNGSRSIQEVFDFIKENCNQLNHDHVAQTLMVLWDLQKVFLNRYHTDSSLHPHINLDEYLTQLHDHPEFLKLLDLIRLNYEKFDTEATSCALMYLNKLGLSIQHPLLLLLSVELRKKLKAEMSLIALSRFLVTTCSESSLIPYFVIENGIPFVIRQLEQCTSEEELKLLTICLYHLNPVITKDVTELYAQKVKELLHNGELSLKNCRTLLKIILFLNSPSNSDKYVTLTSRILKMLKDNLYLFNVPDLIFAYEIFYKNQEPGELLTEIQRCASRLLLHLEEDPTTLLDTKLKLLSATVCFSSPLQRPEYEKIIRKCIELPLTRNSIFDLLRIITFVKPSDTKICERYWDNVLKTLNIEDLYKETDLMLTISQKYMNYSYDLHYRHNKFEQNIIDWMVGQFENGVIDLIPSQLSRAAAFIFVYSNDRQLIRNVKGRMIEIWEQLNHVDCLHLSKSLRMCAEFNSLVTNEQSNELKETIDRTIRTKLIQRGDSIQLGFLIKSYIYTKQKSKGGLGTLLSLIRPEHIVSSNSIRNFVFTLQSTDSLIPEVIDSMVDYIVTYKENLLGFNVEKVIYLCYYLGYLPQKWEELCQTVSDVIIRDQKRISGLSYILTALSLCFYNKLPDSFIKNIFNVEFLDKLDTELSTCYFKDVYPLRVRHNLMQLNRAVCLDYPQANVPWFHQKYVEQISKKAKFKEETIFGLKTYLFKILDPDYVLQDASTPYGYHVNFILHLDNDGNLVKPTENCTEKIAILTMKSSAYTNINVRLKGQYQLKKRHLEILGYKVLIIDLNKWNSFIYAEEKIDYLNSIIWPDARNTRNCSVIER